MKKYFAFSVVSLLMVTVLLFSSCHNSPIKATEQDLKAVFAIGTEKVLYEEIRYLAVNYKNEMQKSYGGQIFEDDEQSDAYLEELRERVVAAASKNAAVIALCKQYGIDIVSKTVTDFVSGSIDDVVESAGGRKEYKAQLDLNCLTDHCLRFFFTVEACRQILSKELYELDVIDDSDETARDFLYGDDLVRTLHVYIQNDEGDDVQKNRELAETVLQELDDGADMKKMIGRYSEDFYMTSTDGYYFMRGEYDKAYEDVAFSLEANEYSSVVETSSGFYIILRLEKEDAYIERNFEELKDRYLYVKFDELVDSYIEENDAEFTQYGKGLDIAKIN